MNKKAEEESYLLYIILPIIVLVVALIIYWVWQTKIQTLTPGLVG